MGADMPSKADIDDSAAQAAFGGVPHDGLPFSAGGVITVAAGHAVHDTYTAFLPPLLPVFIERLLLSKMEAGILSALLQAPSLVQPVIGNWADRASLKILVILAPGLSATAMSLLGVAPTYAALAVLLTVAGITSAGLHAVGPAMAGRLAGRRLGRGMGFWMVGGELGRTIGPILVVTVTARLTLSGLPWLMVLGWCASAVLLYRLRSVSPVKGRSSDRLPWRRAIKGMRRVMLPVAGIILVRAFVVSAITTFLPTYMSEAGASLFQAGASLTILEAAGVVGAMLGGSASDRFGRRRTLVVSMLIAPIAIIAFINLNGGARMLMVPAMGLFGLSVAPVLMAIVQESYPGNRALANGVYMALGFGIRSLVLVLLGLLGDLFSLRGAFYVSAIIMLFGLPLIAALPSSAPSGEQAQPQ
jgi:FSR family fosmidomycin resistance protein-like MFS transporter